MWTWELDGCAPLRERGGEGCRERAWGATMRAGGRVS